MNGLQGVISHAFLALFMRRRELEAALESVLPHPAPDPTLEQYGTPPGIACDLLWAAWEDGDIRDRRVLDLGCGTGILALGAALLGAGEVVGVDVDGGSLDLAREVWRQHGNPCPATWVEADLEVWHPAGQHFDTVVMNPPFGAQRANRGGDRLFYDRAAEALREGGGAAWLLAPTVSERFLTAYARDLGASLERVEQWEYPLPARFDFHSAAVRTIEVGGYRMAFGGG